MKILALSLALLTSSYTWASECEFRPAFLEEADVESTHTPDATTDTDESTEKALQVTVVGKYSLQIKGKLVFRQTEHVIIFEETDTIEEVTDGTDFAKYTVTKDPQGNIGFKAEVAYVNDQGEQEIIASPLITVEENQEATIAFHSGTGEVISFTVVASEVPSTDTIG